MREDGRLDNKEEFRAFIIEVINEVKQQDAERMTKEVVKSFERLAKQRAIKGPQTGCE